LVVPSAITRRSRSSYWVFGGLVTCAIVEPRGRGDRDRHA
jgi:hypothetical protein